MAVGPAPESTGRLRAGAICVTCDGPSHQGSSGHYQEYGGSVCPAGIPLTPCTSDDCTDENACYVPKDD